MIDAHYTPVEVAKYMVDSLGTAFLPAVIADFAAGQGNLLAATERRWPNALRIANDVDRAATNAIRRKFPDWQLTSADFFCIDSIYKTKLKNMFGGVDLAIINPPFSQRGIKPIPVVIGGESFTCGVATAFVSRTIEFLSPSGQMIALLPRGGVHSRRDAKAWEALLSIANVNELAIVSRRAFAEVFPETSIYHFEMKHFCAHVPSNQVSLGTGTEVKLSIVRGRCQMHMSNTYESAVGLPLVHTTHLRKNRVLLDSNLKVSPIRTVVGSALLIPRVGQPSREKLCVLRKNIAIVPSDCVLAIPTQSEAIARQIRSRIVENWDLFVAAHSGTGAPYITVNKLLDFLAWLHLIANESKRK